MELNRDYKSRDKMLEPYFKACETFKEKYWYKSLERWTGGIQHFKAMPVGALEDLIEKGFADSEESQNLSPPISQILEFMKRWPSFVFAHGYAVSHVRDDYRISVEGVEGHIPDDLPQEERQEFEMTFLRDWKQADELELMNNGYFRVWYD